MSESDTKKMNLSPSQIKRYLRERRREGLLTEEQIARLDAIGFEWEPSKPKMNQKRLAIWDEERNGSAESAELSYYNEYWWKCPKCGYRWKWTLRELDNHPGCPVCHGRKPIVGWSDLTTTHPELAAEWDYERNGKLKPTDVKAGQTTMVWWKCGKCGGEWQAKIVNRKNNARVCPYCNFIKLRKGLNDLATIAPEEVRRYYLPELNGGTPADEVLVKRGTRIRWKCPECGHEWTTTIWKRKKQWNSWTACPECQRKNFKEKSLAKKREAVEAHGTLAQRNPELAATWDYERNGGLTPDSPEVGMQDRRWFICKACGKSYLAKVSKKTSYCVECSKKYQSRATKKVVCVETGIVYESIKEANKAMGCKKSAIGDAIRGGGRVKGYHWKYFTD